MGTPYKTEEKKSKQKLQGLFTKEENRIIDKYIEENGISGRSSFTRIAVYKLLIEEGYLLKTRNND